MKHLETTMGDLSYKERLQPSLLDRLTDDEPSRKQERLQDRVLSSAKLRESVRRDLVWLLNTTHLATAEPSIEEDPIVAHSVLNYGVPDFTGRVVSSVDVLALATQLRQAICDFEPRLARDSVKVRLMVDAQRMSHNAMCFAIEAELWAQPVPLRLQFAADVDLEGGTVQVAEMSDRGRC